MDELASREEAKTGKHVALEFHLVQSLHEALKFYNGEEEFPPREAFFSEETYAAYLEDTSVFSQNLLRSILSQQRPLGEIEDELDRLEAEAEAKAKNSG